MSDVEKYYAAICTKWNSPTRTWQQLNAEEQQRVIHSINLLMSVLHR